MSSLGREQQALHERLSHETRKEIAELQEAREREERLLEADMENHNVGVAMDADSMLPSRICVDAPVRGVKREDLRVW